MNDPLVMRCFEPFGNLHEDRDGLIEWNRSSRNTLRERLAFHELHDQELLAFVLLQAVQGCDVRVIELSQQSGLSLESVHAFFVLGELFRQYLDRHIPTELSISR